MMSLFSRLWTRRSIFRASHDDGSAGGGLYSASFDRKTLWDADTIEEILADFPKGYIKESDLFLILSECIANAVLHGQAEELSLVARERKGVILMAFRQTPALLKRVSVILSLARSSQLSGSNPRQAGGLGFPILLRLVRHITISHDYSTLRLWIRKRTYSGYSKNTDRGRSYPRKWTKRFLRGKQGAGPASGAA